VWRSTDGGTTFESSATGMVSLRVTDVVAAADGLALSVRNTEGRDGIHGLAGVRLERLGEGELPVVLDLGVGGRTLYAATERGLWRDEGGRWQRMAALGEQRVEALAATDGWLLARTQREIVSQRGAAVERLPLVGSGGRSVALWGGAAWFDDAGILWRWDSTDRQLIDTPGVVEDLGVFGGELLIDTSQGRFRAAAARTWQRLPVGAGRLLPTGDARLPILALWRDGAATLHDASGAEGVALTLPVPARDVSAAVLSGSRLHLATAGYGLLSSNLLWLGDDAARTGAAPAITSQ
jgi:hypothetical protein